MERQSWLFRAGRAPFQIHGEAGLLQDLDSLPGGHDREPDERLWLRLRGAQCSQFRTRSMSLAARYFIRFLRGRKQKVAQNSSYSSRSASPSSAAATPIGARPPAGCVLAVPGRGPNHLCRKLPMVQDPPAPDTVPAPVRERAAGLKGV